MVLPPYRCEHGCHMLVALRRRQRFLAYWFQLSDWGWQVKIPARGEKNVAGIKACMPQSLSQRMGHGQHGLAGCKVLRGCGIPQQSAGLGGKGDLVHAHTTRARFEQCIMPHLAAAYNLARWLTRHDQDAEDVVQE